MPRARSKIVVVAWDLAHNGASGAFVLADMLRRDADVELVGPTFLGRDTWEPIRDAGVPVRTFPGERLPHFVEAAEESICGITADVIVACKPRFPTLLLSMLIKDQCDAPVVLHIDDFELGLVGAAAPVSLDELERRRRDPDAANPAGRLWVSACEPLIAGADAITVSGEPLRRRYGGIVLGQPRDEHRFDPARIDRRAARAAFGYGDDDRVVLFLGSPRRHKGIRELAAAVAGIDDERVRLCVIGSFTDAGLRAEIAAAAPGRIQLVDYRPVSEVPRLTMIGDLVCLPQQVSVEFVAYQTPMKLTEALAMGIPVLARETPALMPFVEAGVVHPIGERPLSHRIVEVLAAPGDTPTRGLAHFRERLSYAAARRRFDDLVAALPTTPAEIPAEWERACEIAGAVEVAG
jgi:glycosyltransferase involved in cell wall biosynthesis